jgi:hypothetical protein
MVTPLLAMIVERGIARIVAMGNDQFGLPVPDDSTGRTHRFIG